MRIILTMRHAVQRSRTLKWTGSCRLAVLRWFARSPRGMISFEEYQRNWKGTYKGTVNEGTRETVVGIAGPDLCCVRNFEFDYDQHGRCIPTDRPMFRDLQSPLSICRCVHCRQFYKTATAHTTDVHLGRVPSLDRSPNIHIGHVERHDYHASSREK